MAGVFIWEPFVRFLANPSWYARHTLIHNFWSYLNPISKMVLRNVTGPDALRLIATAAGCELDPIMTMVAHRDPTTGGIVGYAITAYARRFCSSAERKRFNESVFTTSCLVSQPLRAR